jgi:hypothetical protein
MKNLVIAAFAVLGASLVVGNALAIEDDAVAEPGRRRELSETLAVSVNNLGLQNVLELSWRRPLSASKSPLLSGAHTAFGVSHTLTPSYTRVGAWAELSPLSVLDLRVGVEPTAYFCTFHSLMSFDAYGDSFSSDSLKERGGGGFGTAGRVYVSPTLKVKAGPVVAVASADFEWWKSDAQGPLFYEPARDTLLKASGDQLLNTSSALLYQYELGPRGQLAAGLIHQLTYVYAAPANQIQRVGVLVVRQFGAKRFGLRHPRLLATVAYYLDDPSKRHQLSAAVALGFKSTR